MSVNYVAVKSPLKTEETSKFIKVIKANCIDKYALAARISDQCSLTESDVVAVLQAYETNLKIEFSKGNNVEIFNLGTLKPCFKADFDNNGNVIKSSIRLSKLRLITKKKFINEAKGYQYKYCGEIDYNKNEIGDRAETLIKYLKEVKPYITCSEYALLNNCTTTTANRDLHLFKDSGLIYADKIGQTYIFHFNKDYININSDEFRFIAESNDPNIDNENLEKNISLQPQQNTVEKSELKKLENNQNLSKDSYSTKSIEEFKTNINQMKKRYNPRASQDDEYVKLFYDLIGGNFSVTNLTSADFENNRFISEEEKTIEATEIVMKKIAQEIGADNIYDEKVIERLNNNVFPMKAIIRKARKIRSS